MTNIFDEYLPSIEDSLRWLEEERLRRIWIWTYFILNQKTGEIKIGKSENPKERVKNLQTGNDGKLELLVAVPGNREKEFQSKFIHLRTSGEWFLPDQDCRDTIIELQNDYGEFRRIKSEDVDKISGNVALHCPFCTNLYVHWNEDARFREDDGIGDKGVAIPMYCENGHRWSLRIVRHSENCWIELIRV